MKVIDGSMGEGGGQLLRTTVALSAITGEPVTVTRIRENRSKPGLGAQHIAAVKAVAGTCGAEVTGATPGSSELTFIPGPLRPAGLRVDVGTAGSVPLVIQAWLPCAIHTGGSLTVTGGTEVPLSPTIDYLDRVLAPVLRAAGAEIVIEIRQRGYYPRGGGEVRVEVGEGRLRPISCTGRSDGGIISSSRNLPAHVARRQAESARSAILDATGESLPVEIDRGDGPSAGSSVTVWRGCRGGSALGRRGYPAESVGRDAAAEFLESDGGEVDPHLADQLLVYIAEYGGSYTSRTLSRHAETICRLLGEFGMAVEVSGRDPVEFSA
ncbi:MAG: RNA 3'-terminal phosphate cyclase [Methanoculleaceae archaeon]